jgi:hypothetical protein
MKTRESASRTPKVTDAVKQASAHVAAAQTNVETAKKASRAARHKRKLAKAAARVAKKRLTQAKKELAKAKRALAEAESEVPVKAKRRSRPKRAVKARPAAEEKIPDAPAENGATAEASVQLVADPAT